MKRVGLAVSAAVVLALGVEVMAKSSKRAPVPVVDAYTEDVMAWRQKRKDRLLSREGWLSLAGLYWLTEGDNRFGSDDDNHVVFPKKAPLSIGVLQRKGREVRVKVNPGLTVTYMGRAVTAMELLSDKTGSPTTLELGTLSFFVIERGDKLGVRLRDSDSDAKKTFHDIPTYPIKSEYKLQARFEPYTPVREIAVPTVLGTIEPSPSPGALAFDWQGKTYRLDAVLEEGSSELFVIFADATNGEETYGPGRFLYAPMAKDGVTTLDFNKAYNPPCAFTPFATCPLPPPQNRLPIRVEAGEKTYGDH
jgi:uncharacterized protein